MSGARVCVAAIAGAHGVRGLVKLKSFTATPEDALAYGPLSDEQGTQGFAMTLKGRVKGLLLAAVEGVGTREAAQALRGTRLYVPRSALPALSDPEEYYQADLVGLRVETGAGESLGRVKAVHNFGAGDLLEVEAEDGGTQTFAFTRAVVPEVDIAAGRLVVAPPETVTAEPPEAVAGTGQSGSEAP